MLSLIGSFIGFFMSAMPALIKLFQDYQDKKHELKLLELQLKAEENKHLWRMAEIDAFADVEQSRAVYNYNPVIGNTIIDALNGSVRPVITYCFFGLYVAVKLSQFNLLFAAAEATISNTILMMWGDFDQVLFSTVITFWFGNRTFKALMK